MMTNDQCTHPDGHDWDITIWDDGERRCEHCIHCGQTRIVEHETPVCPYCGSEMVLVQRVLGGFHYWVCEDWQCQDDRRDHAL